MAGLASILDLARDLWQSQRVQPAETGWYQSLREQPLEQKTVRDIPSQNEGVLANRGW